MRHTCPKIPNTQQMLYSERKETWVLVKIGIRPTLLLRDIIYCPYCGANMYDTVDGIRVQRFYTDDGARVRGSRRNASWT